MALSKVGLVDVAAITGETALAETPADTDELLLNDGGTIKRIDYSHIKTDLTAVADGSAGSPSIANSGDTNTGIYFPAADKVGITTAGNLNTTFLGDANPQQIQFNASGGGDGIFQYGPW